MCLQPVGLQLKLALAFPLPAETPTAPGCGGVSLVSLPLYQERKGTHGPPGPGGLDLLEAFPEMAREGFRADIEI